MAPMANSLTKSPELPRRRRSIVGTVPATPCAGVRNPVTGLHLTDRVGTGNGASQEGGDVIADREFTRFVPTPDQYAWTFGGYDPVLRIRPGQILDVFTEDAFGGKIRTRADLPSRTIVYPFINPQTGPFYVEGAEVGDTLAIHLIDVQPARD